MFLLGKQSKLPVNYLSKIYLPTLVPNRELKSERSGLGRLQTACDIYAAIFLTNQERRGADGGRTLTVEFCTAVLFGGRPAPQPWYHSHSRPQPLKGHVHLEKVGQMTENY